MVLPSIIGRHLHQLLNCSQSMLEITIGKAMPEIVYIRSGVEPAEPSVASGLQTTPATYGAQSGPPTKRPWQVLLVDDDAAGRAHLRGLLEAHADFQVVGEACDGEEAVVLAERYRPDIMLMDIHLPRVSGVEATRQINERVPQCRVIAMSSLYTPHSYNAMMAAGAVAFVHKADAAEALYKTLAFAINTYCPSLANELYRRSDDTAIEY